MKNTKVRRTRISERGSVYITVLGVSLLVTVMGLGGLLAVQARAREAGEAGDTELAQQGARGAVELARLAIAKDSSWRTRLTSGSWNSTVALGRGRIQWRVVDETDGNLANNDTDAVRVHGMGTVGNSVRVCSVVLNATKVPMDVLRTTAHSSGLFDVRAQVTTVNGPISTNGTLSRGATITGDAEAVLSAGTGTVTGTLTSPSATKPMPSQTVLDLYKAKATTIPWGGGGGGDWTIAWPLLSPGINPSGSGLNADGIYYISVPTDKKVLLQIKRILGTLVIECASGAALRVSTSVCWESTRTDLPALMLRHNSSTYSDDWIAPYPGTLSEAALGVNLNPSGSPYLGATNATMTDSYPSQIKGLIHVMAPVPNANRTALSSHDNANIIGTVICDAEMYISTNGVTYTFDPALYANPPQGYYTVSMTVAPSTWRREAAP